MTEFNGFSEAARLYAENVDVIREVKKAYEQDVAAFIEVLEHEIRRSVAPDVFNSYQTKDFNRYWWLGEGRARTAAPYLWLDTNDPSDVGPERIVLWGGTEQKNDSLVQAMVNLPQEKPMEVEPVEDGPNRWFAFTVAIPLAGKDAVEKAAKRISDVLRLLQDLEVRVAKSLEIR